MDNTKVGELIRRLRKESHMTQQQLAEKLHVSDKAVSKWERGMGCPEVSLMTSDTVMLKKQYPEWGLQVRIPVFAHGRLLWYCNRHGLFYQEV